MVDKIDQETEIHRIQKALKQLVGSEKNREDILLPDSRVLILASKNILSSFGGQLCVTMIVNLIARMKSIVNEVLVPLPFEIEKYNFVPLFHHDFRIGIQELVESLSGPNSEYRVKFYFDDIKAYKPTVVLSLHPVEKNYSCPVITLGADDWTAFINSDCESKFTTIKIPIGAFVAGNLGVAEVFKHLLRINFPSQSTRKIHFLNNINFCALDYTFHPLPHQYSSLPEQIEISDLAIAGVGAGGSAALYTLSCFPNLYGDITLIDPGKLKKSNLARYLLTSYQDISEHKEKVEVASSFMSTVQSNVTVNKKILPYHMVNGRNFHIVLSTVDNPEGRWDIQKDNPSVILDASVVDTIYSLLRVDSCGGMCLGCKHPYDPDITWKKRAKMWGKSVLEMKELFNSGSKADEVSLRRLAEIQGRPMSNFLELLGMKFSDIPAITECGETRLTLQVPNQLATLPFVTTIAGVLLAGEVIKELYLPTNTLHNWYEHNLLWIPKGDRYRFRIRDKNCNFCKDILSDR